MRICLVTAFALATLVAPAARAADSPPTTAAATPDSALDAPAFFGFEVLEARRGVNGKGWPTSTTMLNTTLDELYSALSALFGGAKEFAPGWTVAGVGKSDQHGFVSATLQDPTGQRFTCEARRREASIVQVELTARAYQGSGGRMTAPPAPDRNPPAGTVKP